MKTLLFCLAALLITWLLYKPSLQFARKYTLLDNPEARKLQKQPVPVLGGVAVAGGIFLPIMAAALIYRSAVLNYEIVVMACMVMIGVWDDFKQVSASLRFVMEIFLVWFLLWQTEMVIEDLHGLWGQDELITLYWGLPLSIFAGVGIINAINMIDGVDGYSSGYGIIANALFGMVFFLIGDYIPGLLSFVAASALIPFYLHNVFGRKSKMYIGDGGSLLIGMVMVCDVFALLTRDSASLVLQEHNVCVVALALAILCVPVFDTLRVMFARILNHRSPFSPDMTHLHHAFIRMGFSHVGTSTFIILLNVLIVGAWFASWRMGAGIDMQFYVVVFFGLLVTCGIYYGSEYSAKKENAYIRVMRNIGKWTHFEDKGAWGCIQRLMDKI